MDSFLLNNYYICAILYVMEYKYELHCHTKYGSRQCGRVEPKEIVKLYKEQGYSGIVVTDHYSPLTFDFFHGILNPKKFIDCYINPYYDMKQYEDESFSVMFGMELRHYGTANDYLVYGVDPEWLRQQGNLLALMEDKAYQLMHEQGYLVFQAHPFRPGIRRCNPKYIDGIEVYNGKTNRQQNGKAYDWAVETGKLMSSGSDFHVPRNLARGGIITTEPIKNNDDLLRVLKAQDFKRIEVY